QENILKPARIAYLYVCCVFNICSHTFACLKDGLNTEDREGCRIRLMPDDYSQRPAMACNACTDFFHQTRVFRHSRLRKSAQERHPFTVNERYKQARGLAVHKHQCLRWNIGQLKII